jgi:putative transcriptional regulator
MIAEIRKRTGLSQSAFAERYHIPLATLRNWEQDRREPPDYLIYMLDRLTRIDFPE